MEDKRTKIINAAMNLFSEKGFHATSMQEVADLSNVSKGTIYTYFSSKDDLLYSIFEYFYESIKSQMDQTNHINLPPREKFTQQIDALIHERSKYKGFFKMVHREQMLTDRKNIHHLLINIQLDTFDWYRNNLLDIYGEQVIPYLPDGCIMLESLLNGYIRLLVFKEELIDIDRLAGFITLQIDNLIQAMMTEHESPLLPIDTFERVHAMYSGTPCKSHDVENLLKELGKTISTLQLNEIKREELRSSLEFLESEIKKDKPQAFLIKGVLSNFEGITETNDIRKKLGEHLI